MSNPAVPGQGNSEEIFRLLVEGVTDYAIFMLDPAGIIVSWNPGAERIKGYKREEIVGKHFSTFYRNEDIDRGHPAYELEVATRTGKYEEEGLRVRKDGSVFAARVLITALNDASGRLKGFSKVTRDITEQQKFDALKAAAQAIENERTNFRNLYQHTPEMVCILRGSEHVFEFVNEAHIRVVGMDATGKTVREAQPESVEVHAILDSVYLTGKTVELHEAPITVGERIRYFNLTFSARKNVDGSIGGVMLLGAEVTDSVTGREGTALLNKALQLALNNAPLPEVLTVLTIMVEKQTGGTLLASVLLASEDGSHLLHGAAPSLPKEYNELIHGVSIGPSVGSCGTAAFRKEPVFVSDIQVDPLWKDFKQLAAQHGLAACWSIPILKQNGKLIGTFALYSAVPRSPTSRELETARAAAQTTALILERRNEIDERLAALSALKVAKEEAERANEATLGERQTLEEVLNQTTVPMALLRGPEHRFSYTNKAYELAFGFATTPKGKLIDEVFPDAVEQGFKTLLDKVYSTGKSYQGVEVYFERSNPDGAKREFYVDFTYAAKRNVAGKIEGILATIVDVTEKVLARKAVEAAKDDVDATLKKLHSVVENAEVGFILSDFVGNIESMNPEALRIHGFSNLNEMRKHVSEYADLFTLRYESGGELVPFDKWPINRVLAGERFKNYELHVTRNDTGDSWIASYGGTPVYDDNSEMILAVTTLNDVTARVQQAQELLIAKEEAERANELKSAFLANMSHEIRTPLGAMMGFADLLKDPGVTASERQSFANILSRNGESLSVIINDILDLSKVEAGHLTLEYTDTYPDQIGEDVVSLLRVKANEKNLVLEYSHDEASPRSIVADPTRVRQILLNLVGNAIKFTQFGSVRIKSFACKTERGRDALCFEVADTGIGVPKTQHEKIFDMFVQADGSMTRRFGGTGLGLALSRSLARAMGGNIVITDSRENVGSTFLVTIEDQPDLRDEGTASAAGKTTPHLQEPLENSLAGVKVLVVDDAPDNQQLIWRYLNKQGAVVTSAENGLVGYRAALSGDFDVVLMDIQMPIMDGYSATQKLREAGYRKPIIALTAHAMSEVRKKALNVGYTDHLTKPINQGDLIRTIAKYTETNLEL